jgi:hypothetical protein
MESFRLIRLKRTCLVEAVESQFEVLQTADAVGLPLNGFDFVVGSIHRSRRCPVL